MTRFTSRSTFEVATHSSIGVQQSQFEMAVSVMSANLSEEVAGSPSSDDRNCLRMTQHGSLRLLPELRYTIALVK